MLMKYKSKTLLLKVNFLYNTNYLKIGALLQHLIANFFTFSCMKKYYLSVLFFLFQFFSTIAQDTNNMPNLKQLLKDAVKGDIQSPLPLDWHCTYRTESYFYQDSMYDCLIIVPDDSTHRTNLIGIYTFDKNNTYYRFNYQNSKFIYVNRDTSIFEPFQKLDIDSANRINFVFLFKKKYSNNSVGKKYVFSFELINDIPYLVKLIENKNNINTVIYKKGHNSNLHRMFSMDDIDILFFKIKGKKVVNY